MSPIHWRNWMFHITVLGGFGIAIFRWFHQLMGNCNQWNWIFKKKNDTLRCHQLLGPLGDCFPAWEKMGKSSNSMSSWWLTYPSEKYDFVSWDDYPIYCGKSWKSCSKAPTRCCFEWVSIHGNTKNSCIFMEVPRWESCVPVWLHGFDMGHKARIFEHEKRDFIHGLWICGLKMEDLAM